MTGQILDITADAYHQDAIDGRPSLNASTAKLLIAESPRHAWTAHAALNPRFERKEEQKFDVGTVVHRMLLEPEAANRVAVIDAKDWRTKAAQEARDQARDEGDTPLLTADYDRVIEMLTAVRDQINRLDLDPLPFYAGKAEQTLTWEDERTDVLCRARLDWLHNDMTVIDDLKSTKRTANPYQWKKRTLWSIGAHIQDAFYRRGVKAVSGIDADLRFIIAESHPPFSVSVVTVGESGRALAEAQLDRALDIWKTCLETNVWPSYTAQIVEADAPPWLEYDWYEAQDIAFDEEAA